LAAPADKSSAGKPRAAACQRTSGINHLAVQRHHPVLKPRLSRPRHRIWQIVDQPYPTKQELHRRQQPVFKIH
jgi:hypothetical protein